MDKSTTIIAIAADHAGYELKERLAAYLSAQGFRVLDSGTYSSASVDYPEYGKALAGMIASGKATMGIGICGTGIGMSIALNRNPAIRAALCHDSETARLARAHNDANVLVLGGRLTAYRNALDCVETFFSTDFEGGRHARRVEKLSSCCT